MESRRNTSAQAGLSAQVQLGVALIALLIIFSRRPDAFLNAQFYAEDGRAWFQDAYNNGWAVSLLSPLNGYFQTLSRLTAALALLVPFRYAPVVMNLVAVAIQILPVTLLLSSRSASFAPLMIRGCMAATYLVLPNAAETRAILTTAQWHLGLIGCLLILSDMPQRPVWRAFDLTAVALCGVSGPFCLMLLPIGLWYWWLKRDAWRLSQLAVLAAGALIQLSAVLRSTSEDRGAGILGASVASFLKILAGHVYLGALIGGNALAGLNGEIGILLAVIALLGTVITGYCFYQANAELRMFIAFCALMFAAALANPYRKRVTGCFPCSPLSGV
jgi:hypothetical protein